MTNIEFLRAKHKREIKELQENCPHTITEIIVCSSFESRVMCKNCGKIIKRIRGE